MIYTLIFLATSIFAGSIKASSDSLPAIFSLLDSEDGRQSQQALSKLIKLSTSSNWKMALPFLTFGTEMSRHTACKFIRNTKNPEYLSTFLKRMESEKSEWVGWCLANGIGEAATTADVPAIAKTWRKTKNKQNRFRLMQSFPLDSTNSIAADTIASLRKTLKDTMLWEARFEESRLRKYSHTLQPDSINAWWKAYFASDIYSGFAQFIDPKSVWFMLGDTTVNIASRIELLEVAEDLTFQDTIPCETWLSTFSKWTDLLTHAHSLHLYISKCNETQRVIIRKLLVDTSGKYLIKGASEMDLGTLWDTENANLMYRYVLNRAATETSDREALSEACQTMDAYLETAKPSLDWLRAKQKEHRPYDGINYSMEKAICHRPNSKINDNALCGEH